MLVFGIAAIAQEDFSATQPPKIKPYVMPKLEVVGPIGLITYPITGGIRKTPLEWPTWQVATVEVGIAPHAALVAGLGGRYRKDKRSELPAYNDYRNSRFGGAKFLLGFRQYFTGADGQGWYFQPTAKLVWQGYRVRTSEIRVSNSNVDFILSSRLGWQKRLVKGLHIDMSAGPGWGVRNELTHDYYGFSYYWDTQMSEIDHAIVPVIDSYGRQWTSVYLVVDANLALAWKF